MSSYLIWSNEHGGWWRPYEHGNTKDILEASHYPRETALRVCRDARFGSRDGVPKELPIRVDDLMQAGILQVPQ